MLTHWIWLATRPALNDRAKAGFLEHFPDPEDMFYAGKSDFDHLDFLTPEGRQALQDKNLEPAEQILEACRREKLHIVTYRDAAYPRRLQNIPDPPVVLYYKGNLPQLDENPVVAVVGTRKASAYGLTAAKRLGYQIGRCGGIVVSGMARGIDGLAMAGALTAGAEVVGVLGCGAEQIYPLSNRALFADTQRFGCILSEFPPGTPPAKWTFPKRNRIISGLSNGVLVVEAPEKSGALITASLAVEQGRDVFVVPGNIDMPSFAGSNRLLREGATLASSGWDILSEYQALYPDKIRRDESPAALRAYPQDMEESPALVAQKPRRPENTENLKEDFRKKAVDNEPNGPYSDLDPPLPDLTQQERQIYDCLRQGQRLVDDIVAETGLTTGTLLAALTMLELKGLIRRLPGRQVILREESSQ